jgi:hypothetical protein
LYLICALEEEMCFHILWGYPSTRNVWGGSLKKNQKSSLGGPTFGGVVEELFKMCDEGELRLFVGIAKRIWF